jgi:hypothetical protein
MSPFNLYPGNKTSREQGTDFCGIANLLKFPKKTVNGLLKVHFWHISRAFFP